MDLERVQAGQGGVPGALARVGLSVLAAGWRLAWHARRATYALWPSLRERLPVPVISVGNLAVGGTGKTPFTAWLAHRLREQGRRPGILSRGYGPPSASSRLSDEGAVLRHVLGDDVPQVEEPRRSTGGRRLLREHPDTDVLLLDDGFQHWRVARDLDVVLLDATNPFGYDHLLPRGRLREPPSALARAGHVVVTRAGGLSPSDAETLHRRIAAYTDAHVAFARTRPTGLVVAGRTESPSALAGRSVYACCGIGNPRAFVGSLEDLGAQVVGTRFLPDHAAPADATWDQVRAEARRANASLLVITRKDAVKHASLPEGVAVLDVATEIVEGEASLLEAVRRVAG